MPWAYKKSEICGYPRKLALFVKVGHGDLILWIVTLSGNVHVLIEFQRSDTYEKLHIWGLPRKLNGDTFHKSRSQQPGFVEMIWSG